MDTPTNTYKKYVLSGSYLTPYIAYERVRQELLKRGYTTIKSVYLKQQESGKFVVPLERRQEGSFPLEFLCFEYEKEAEFGKYNVEAYITIPDVNESHYREDEDIGKELWRQEKLKRFKENKKTNIERKGKRFAEKQSFVKSFSIHNKGN